MTNQINLSDLERALTEAQGIAKDLAADPHQGKSQFAASLRSALDHAADLLALQKQWAETNPAKS